MKKLKVSIYIAVHKPYPVLMRPGFVPIQVGAGLPGRTAFLPVRDDIGDNISAANGRYCELTAIYWALHNDRDSDWIGLYHYRRYLWPPIGKLSFFSRRYTTHLPLVDSKWVGRYARAGAGGIVGEAGIFPCTVREQYSSSHFIEDLELAFDNLVSRDAGWDPFCREFLRGKALRQYNMFVVRRSVFIECWSLLLDVLSATEKNLDFKKYSDMHQNRVLGYLSERLFSVWAMRHGLRLGLIDMPVLSVETDPTILSRVIGKARRRLRGA